jgi:cell division protein FtsB
MRRVLATLAVGVLAFLIGYKAIFGANGMLVYRAKRAELQRLQQEIERQNQENRDLSHYVAGLQSDPRVIEKEAREQLGYVKKGETILLERANKPDAQLPVSASASAAVKAVK